MKRFTRENLEVDKVDDKVQLTTFEAGLKSRGFVVSLAKNPPKMMAEILLNAHEYMSAEDALAVIKDVEKSNEKGRKEDIREDEKGSMQIVRVATRVKGKMIKLLGW